MLSTVLASPRVLTQSTYVSGGVGTYALHARVRFTDLPARSFVDDFGAGVGVIRAMADNESGSTYADPSTGSTALSTASTLDLELLTAAATYHARFRLEFTPTTPAVVGTCTLTAATNLVTLTAHGLGAGDIIRFTTTGSLSGTGLTVGTDYYVQPIGVDTFKVATTETGTEIDITATGTGTHTVTAYRKAGPWTAYSDGSSVTFTTFAAPAVESDMAMISSLTVATMSEHSLLCTWDSPSVNGGYFTVQVCTAGSLAVLAGGAVNLSALETSHLFDGLIDPGTDGGEIVVLLQLFGEYVDTGDLVLVPRRQADFDEIREFGVLAAVDEDTPITGPITIQLRKSAVAAAQWTFGGAGTVVDWSLSGFPAGLTLLTPSPQNRIAQLDGTPATEGIYYGTITCRSKVGYTRTASIYEVLVAVSGGLCLGWFHADITADSSVPPRRDLQIFLGDRSVASFAAGSSPIELRRGDDETIWVIFRRGTLALPGPVINDVAVFAAYSELRLTLLAIDDLDGAPVFTKVLHPDGGIVPEDPADDGMMAVKMEFNFTSPALEQRFVALAAGNPPDVTTIECMAEFTWTDSAGKEKSTERFRVNAEADLDY
jgi:hypothetical protein